MAWSPTLLEDSLDPWLAIEPDAARRRAVLEFLVRLCEADGRLATAVEVRGTQAEPYSASVGIIERLRAIDERTMRPPAQVRMSSAVLGVLVVLVGLQAALLVFVASQGWGIAAATIGGSAVLHALWLWQQIQRR